MTYNGFKFCCLIFRKHFEGKKYGEVIENGFYYVNDFIINNSLKIDGSRFCFKTEETILYFFKNAININRPSYYGELFFNTIEDFLNHFKIPLKDIV